jgi:hypothetical protein
MARFLPAVDPRRIELRLIDKRELDMIKRAARDSEVARRFGLPKDGSNEYFHGLMRVVARRSGNALAERASASSRSSGATSAGPGWGTDHCRRLRPGADDEPTSRHEPDRD